MVISSLISTDAVTLGGKPFESLKGRMTPNAIKGKSILDGLRKDSDSPDGPENNQGTHRRQLTSVMSKNSNSRLSPHETRVTIDKQMKSFRDNSINSGRRPLTANLQLPPRNPSLYPLKRQNLGQSREKEMKDEEHENALMKETLKLPLKPACFFAVAIPFNKAHKPDLQHFYQKITQNYN